MDTSNTHKIFTDVEFQTKLVTNYDYGGDSGWSTDTGGTSGSRTYTETASTIATGSHTRWFRVRSRGPRGTSDWRYGCRVYSSPYAATNVKGEVTKQAGGMQTKVTWSQTKNSSYPVDTTVAEYAIKVPGLDITYNGTADGTIGTIAGAGGAASSFISQNLEKDECLFVRVGSTHLYKTTYSQWVLADTGFLKDPEITDIQADDTTFRAIVTASNKSDVPGSFLVVLYRTGSEPNKQAVVGIIPAGETSVTVQCPDWSEEDTYEFGVYACVGSYAQIARADSVDSYSVTPRMKSEAPVWQGGQVPHAPTNVSVNSTSISGTVKVTWDWTWRDAQSAVISWADHEDAWESTDEPETYTINNTHAGEWNVSGLETGKRWYFRVRLMKGTGETGVYGAWSAPAVIDLSSAPAVPNYDRLECNFRKSGECDLLPINISEFNDLKEMTLRRNEELDHAVVFDDRIDFHLTGRTVRSVPRSLPVNKAISGKIVCGCCGNRFRRMNQYNGKVWCCKVRASDRTACKVRSILEAELLGFAAKALGNPDNLNMRIYCDIKRIEVYEKTVTIHLKGGKRSSWQRR